MKYVIIGCSSEVNIRKNTTKIRYAKLYRDENNELRLYTWVDNIKDASKINNKDEAVQFARQLRECGALAFPHELKK